MASLYIHINKINNKKYVGISSYSDPSMRWGKNGSGYKNSLFYDKGIIPFGWDCFEHRILLTDIDIETAQQIEARIIKVLNLTDNSCGYNESAGATIKSNSVFDDLTNNLILKLKAPDVEDLALFEANYQYRTTMYKLSMLLWVWNEGKINTDLDCQRGYVWTEDRQQGLWDTLLFGHRIPEIHAIRTSKGALDVIDGKQRLTTLINILNNNIPCKKTYSNQKLEPLFKILGKSSFYFKDLPEKFQNKLLDTEIPVAEYWDITDEDMVTLFRKLNAGASLSEFSKGIANYINIRLRYTRAFTSPEHPALKKFFSEKDISSSEDEKYLIRLMIMLKTSLNCNCAAREMSQYYNTFTTQDLLKYQKIVMEYLNKVEHYMDLLSFSSKKSYFPIISYIIITNNFNEKQIRDFFIKIDKQHYVGRGEELSHKEINTRYNKLMSLLKEGE